MSWSLRRVAYPAALWIGMTLGLATGALLARPHGIEPVKFMALGALLTAVGLLGARGLFVATYAGMPRPKGGSVAGLALNGGLLAGGAVALAVAIFAELPAGAFLDAAMAAFLIGLAVTKFGCLSAGCCSGRLVFGRSSVPSQLIEAGWALVVLLMVVVVVNSGHLPGTGAASGACAFAVSRLVTERLRNRPSAGVVGRLRANDVGSMLVAAAGVTGMVVI